MELSKLFEQVQELTDEEFLVRFPHPFLLEEGRMESREEERLVFPLTLPLTSLGRGSKARARVCRRAVSGEHAELRRSSPRDGEPVWRLVDLGSTNGTYLDNTRLAPGAPARVWDESVIGLGPARFTFLSPRSLLVILRSLQARSAEFKCLPGRRDDADDFVTMTGSQGGSGLVVGSLDKRGVVELFEDVERNQRTGSLLLAKRDGGRVGRVSFRAGHLVDASTEDGLCGIRAVKELVKLEQGRFLLENTPPTGPQRISTSFSEILRGVEKKRSKRALALSEAQLRATLENAFHGIVSCTKEGDVLSLNTRAQQMFGQGPDEPGLTLETILSCQTGGVVDRLLSAQGAREVQELTGVRKGGVEFPIEVAVTRVAADGRCTWSLAVQDLTTRKQAERDLRETQAALQQSQKMDAIGQLAAGITHDFNNLLSVINGYSELMVGDLPAEDRHRKHAQRILEAGQRANGLTKQLLAFCRRQELNPEPTDLNEVIGGLAGMLRRLIGGIELKAICGPNLAKVLVDKGQLEQVLMNLVVNARDAMPDGGRILVATTNVVVNESSRACLSGLAAGPYVRLTVTDTGHGMSPETTSRIFEPFFTTKPKGKGTGLGLATIYGIVKQSKGHITVESSEGSGTTFAIYLPRLAAVSPPEPAASAINGSSARLDMNQTVAEPWETILVAEDQDEVRDLVRDVLSSNGYHVIEAVDGQEALELFEQLPGRFDLLLTDVRMPRKDGIELTRVARELKQGLKVLYMSAESGLGLQGESFLPKPFTPKQLVYAVRQTLDAISE